MSEELSIGGKCPRPIITNTCLCAMQTDYSDITKGLVNITDKEKYFSKLHQ